MCDTAINQKADGNIMQNNGEFPNPAFPRNTLSQYFPSGGACTDNRSNVAKIDKFTKLLNFETFF